MKKISKIGNVTIGFGMPPFIIAEVSGNHNGDINRALKLIDIAKESGANAVKFQTFTPDSLTLNTNKNEFTLSSGTWKGQNLYELYKKTQTPLEWFPTLFNHAKKINIIAFSSAFDTEMVDFLENLKVPAYKIASNEFSDFPLIKRIAQTKKPVIMSTGTSTYTEIKETLNFARSCGIKNPIVLHCISAYPAKSNQLNLNTIQEFKNKFNVISGFSDHTLGNTSSIASVALGSSVIEKHITIDRNDGGPDSSFSLEPQEFKSLCKNCYTAWESLGSVKFGGEANLKKNNIFTRQYWSLKNIKKGEILDNTNIKSIRAPSDSGGVSTRYFAKVINSTALKDIAKHSPIFLTDINSKEDNLDE